MSLIKFEEFTKNQIDRFYRSYSIDDNTNCWHWIAHKYKNGYGRMNVGKKQCLSHRFSWVLYGNNLQTGRVICHRCDNRDCVNPEHLFQGTQSDNLNDMKEKGRSCFGEKNGMAKLPIRYVKLIRIIHRFGDFKISEIADFFNVSKSCVQSIVSRSKWKHI